MTTINATKVDKDQAKLTQYCEMNEIEEDDFEFWKEQICDSVIDGICMNDGCEYTTHVEPDCEHGWCELCDTKTVKSILMLKGLV